MSPPLLPIDPPPPTPEWYRITDPTSSSTFFANPQTGECAWQLPPNTIEMKRDVENEWWELFDDQHQLPYYYKTTTGETEWTKPKEGTVIGLRIIQQFALQQQANTKAGDNPSKSDQPKPPSITTPPIPKQRSSLTNTQKSSQQSLVGVVGATIAEASTTPPKIETTIIPGEELPKAGNHEEPSSPVLPIQRVEKSDAVAKVAREQGVGAPQLNPSVATQMRPIRHSLPQELQHEITRFKVDGFASKYFETHKKGVFRRKIPVKELMEYTKDSLPKPLLVMNKSLHKDALKCFKLIQKIMGTNHGTKSSNVYADIQLILEKGVLVGPLRDEIYVQICKQLNANPNMESVYRGWEIFCCMAIIFPPSKNFELYLHEFLDNTPRTDEKIDTFVTYCKSKLIKICIRGPRGKTPTIPEIERAILAPFQASIFGNSLEEILQNQTPPARLPRIVPFLIDTIKSLNGFHSEGLFRVPGDAEMITDLRVRLEKGQYNADGVTDPNVPASLLKLWMRELSDPVLGADVYDQCIKGSEDVQVALGVIQSLPAPQKDLVHAIIGFLQQVGKPENQPFTKMTVNNLAMVFAPNFLRCPSETPQVIFENTRYEQSFIRTLINHLEVDNNLLQTS